MENPQAIPILSVRTGLDPRVCPCLPVSAALVTTMFRGAEPDRESSSAYQSLRKQALAIAIRLHNGGVLRTLERNGRIGKSHFQTIETRSDLPENSPEG